MSLNAEINEKSMEEKNKCNNKTTNDLLLNENQIKCELIDDNMNVNNSTTNANTNANPVTNTNRLRRGRKTRRLGGKVDMRAKLERSRQSARECRARKKLRYQYLEDLVVKREVANNALKEELQMYRQICQKIDSGHKPQDAMVKAIEVERLRKNNRRA